MEKGKITKEYIESITNDKTLNQAIQLQKLEYFNCLKKTENDDLFFAECSYNNNKKKHYNVSVDFSSKNIMHRCNCHSTTLPCKHIIALLFEIIDKYDDFEVSDAPLDIIRKREVIKAIEENKNNKEIKDEVIIKKVAKNKKIRSNKNKGIKKISIQEKMKYQLNMLIKIENFINNLLEQGIMAIEVKPINDMRYLSKELGNCDLIRLKDDIDNMIDSIEIIKMHKEDKYYVKIIYSLVRISYSCKLHREYLSKSIKSNDEQYSDDFYEFLVGKWSTEQLKNSNLSLQNVKLMQLALYSENFHTARKNIDISYYINIDTGKINYTENIHSFKTTKYEKNTELHFNLLNVESVYNYPESYTKRIYFEKYELLKLKSEYFKKVYDIAKDINYAVTAYKKYKKKFYARNKFPVLIHFEQIGFNESNILVLRDDKKRQIEIRHERNLDIYPKIKINNLSTLTHKELYIDNVLFGEIYFSSEENSLFIVPLSIITKNSIIYL